MSRHFDVIVLGTGPSASRIATACAERFRVAIVDSRPLGGNCALRGCNPKKVLVRAAELMDRVRRSDGQLIDSNGAEISWRELMAFKRTFTEPIPAKTKENFEKKGIATFQAPAAFTGSRSLRVGDQELTARFIAVCTGAKPVPLDIPGEEHLIHSDAFLDLVELPRKLLFVGGGYISFEFAHVARRAGAEVCIVDHNAQPLSGFDPDLVQQLVAYSRTQGIQIELETDARVISRNGADESVYRVFAIQSNKEVQITAEAVVHGAGRVPAVDELDLPAAGIESDPGGIRVNEFLQSVSNPLIYAAGDVASTDQPKLTPVANQQGRTVAKNLLDGNRHTADYGPVPKVVFSVPPLAAVGLSEETARERGHNFEVRAGDMSSWNSQRKVGCACAGYKILIDKKTDQILGAHLLAPEAAETINLFALAMKHQLTATNMKSVLFAFPTFSADVRNML